VHLICVRLALRPVERVASVEARTAETHLVAVFAIGVVAAAAEATVSTGWVRHHHVVARLDAFHSCADLLDDTRPLMAEDQGQRHRIILVANVDVGLAEAGRDNSYEHLVLAGLSRSSSRKTNGPDLVSTTAARIRIAFPLPNTAFTDAMPLHLKP